MIAGVVVVADCVVAVVVCDDDDVGAVGVGVAGVADGVAGDVDVDVCGVDVDMCGGGDAVGCACVTDVVVVGVGCDVVCFVCAD